MTALPVAFYLKELSGEVPRRRGVGAHAAEEASDLDFQIREAHARGVLEGRAAAQAEHDAAAAQQAAAFEQRLASERERWASEHGERLGALIAGALDELEGRVSDLVGEILKPVLVAEIRAKAVAELARTLNDLLSKGAYAKLTISAPADLLDSLKTRLGGEVGGVSFAVAEGVDISVNADETILATQIGAWAEAIGGSEP